MRRKWPIFIPILIAAILLINDCKHTNNKPLKSKAQSSNSSYSNYSYNSYESSNDSYNDQSTSTSTYPSLKAQSGELILEKTKSPGYYKIKGNSVIELWDDGTVAETYQAIGFYKSIAEFKKAFKGVNLTNPLRSIDTGKINGLLLFGPVNEDYDEYRDKTYDVYGLITIIGTGFEYYENTLGNSNIFTYIQDLEFVDQKR